MESPKHWDLPEHEDLPEHWVRRWGQTFAGRRSVSCSTRCWSRCEGETTKFQQDYQLLVQNEACLIHHSLRSILCSHGSQGFIFLRCNLWHQDTHNDIQHDIEIIATLSITVLNTGMVSVTMPNVSKLGTVNLGGFELVGDETKIESEKGSLTLFPTICPLSIPWSLRSVSMDTKIFGL